MKTRAFTLVELMVVIAIIAILAVGSITSYRSYQVKTAASRVQQELFEYERAIRVLSISNGTYAWPRENTFTGSNNPPFGDTGRSIGTDDLQGLVNSTPNPNGQITTGSGTNNGRYFYDNDGDTLPDNDNDGCFDGTGSSRVFTGVTITISGVPYDVATWLDGIVEDDQSLRCGKLRALRGTRFPNPGEDNLEIKYILGRNSDDF